MKKIYLLLVILINTAFLYASPDGWTINTSAFEYSQTFTGIVEVDGEYIAGENDLLAAFVGGECRGVAEATYIEQYDKYCFFLSVFSTDYEGDEVTVKFYGNETDSIYTGFQNITFQDGLNTGTASEPYVFKSGSADLSIELAKDSISENLPAETLISELELIRNGKPADFSFELLQGAENVLIQDNKLLSAKEYDFENEASFNIKVVAYNEDSTEVVEQTLLIKIIDESEAFELKLSSNTIPENNTAPFSVGELSMEIEDPYTLAISDNEEIDNNYFRLEGNTIFSDSIFNYEADSVFVIEIIKTINDEKLKQVFTIKITDVEEPGELTLNNSRIDEGNSIPAFIGECIVIDEDLDEVYSINFKEGENDNDLFSIKNDSLFAEISFDYETKTEYLISIIAESEDGEILEKDFTISINDVEEAFQVSLSTSMIDENNAEDQFIAKLLTDTEGEYTFTLTDNEAVENSSFMIKNDSLFANTVFNYEEDSIYQIEILTQTATDELNSFFTIKVSNIEESGELLLSNKTIHEGNEIPSFIGTVSVTDEDLNEIYTIALSDILENDNTLFSIKNDSLWAIQSFDFETKNEYTVQITALYDDGEIIDSLFKISVKDVEEGVISLSNSAIYENNDSATFVGLLDVTVNDPEISFEYMLIEDEATDNKWFYIKGDSLMTDSVFDYEKQNQFNISIQAKSSNDETLENSFVIEILDLEERTVKISANSIAENTASDLFFAKIMVEGDQSEKMYTYAFDEISAQMFSINNDSIFTDSIFDFETTKSLDLTVFAIDEAKDSLKGMFTLFIKDIEEQGEISIQLDTITENAEAGTFLGEIMVYDTSSTISYTVHIDSSFTDWEYFTLENDSISTTEVLNYEMQSEYELGFIIINSDKDTTYFNTVFEIENEKEHPSLIVSNTTIAEHNTSPAFIGTVSVKSESADPFSIEIIKALDGTDFYLQSDSLFSAIVFDYEEKADYELMLYCNNGSSSFYQEIDIHIEDMPEIGEVGSSDIAINEEQKAGDFIGKVELLAGIDTLKYTFDIINNDAIYISSDSIFIAKPFNYEKQQEVVFEIMSISSNKDTVYTQFVVAVENKNDEPTDLAISKNAILENLPIGSFVAKITAQDEDADDMLTFKQIFPEGNYTQAFEIRNDSIFTIIELDYEFEKNYSIMISAEDESGASIEKLFQIDIIDENDIETAINDQSEAQIKLYPIPAKQNITVETTEEIVSVQVINQAGAVVLKDNKKHINISELPKGIYLLKAQTTNTTYSNIFSKN